MSDIADNRNGMAVAGVMKVYQDFWVCGWQSRLMVDVGRSLGKSGACVRIALLAP
jgi:hypothetical protein